ncbi:transmembrane 220 family protein [Zunongwangia sp. F260]|uniref:Transmembrane 220 family protein n=1 Tax=Autumnicola lenta TaxID=3075593 RepID=A0ABU3CP15_9FLAO|nr:transmembrane 220 family protein [Zunongwangia sp. F260]MDT0648097.1 transmembrane 220 family protein [Zunongwangia sp. F260]
MKEEIVSRKTHKKSPSRSRASGIFFGLWSLLFLLFCYWQWNDADPEVWMSIYGFAAVMCGLAAVGRFYIPVLMLASIIALLGSLFFFPRSVSDWIFQEWQQADLSMKTIEMEETREFFGLLIISVIMGLAAYKGWREKRKAITE